MFPYTESERSEATPLTNFHPIHFHISPQVVWPPYPESERSEATPPTQFTPYSESEGSKAMPPTNLNSSTLFSSTGNFRSYAQQIDGRKYVKAERSEALMAGLCPAPPAGASWRSQLVPSLIKGVSVSCRFSGFHARTAGCGAKRRKRKSCGSTYIDNWCGWRSHPRARSAQRAPQAPSGPRKVGPELR